MAQILPLKEKLDRALRKRKREEAVESSESKMNQWHPRSLLVLPERRKST